MKQIISKRTIIAYVAVFLVAIAGFIAGSIVDFDIAESINAVYPSNNPTCIQAPVISVIAVGSILPTAFFGGVGGAIVVTSKQNKVFWTWFWRILAAAGTATILYSTYDSIAEAAEIYSVTANHQTLWKVIILIITLFTISGGFLLGLFKFKDIDTVNDIVIYKGCLLFVEEETIRENLDEDEMCRFLQGTNYACPYYRLDDEYGVVRHQN